MIVEQLAGKKVALTGTTGFLGTALVERLLRAVPDIELVLIVRPGRRGAKRRVERDILRNDAFDGLRRVHGDAFDTVVADRVTAVAGDVSVDGLGLDEDGRALLAACDIVIHSAAAVSFDSPLDQAVEINLLGPVRIAEMLTELSVAPHLVAVSTCYVAGSRRGNAPEIAVDASPFFVDVSWRAEVEAARRTRTDVETQSREPGRLTEFRNRARAELGAAGTPALAAKTEQLRTRWVTDQMAEAGRARAGSLGFPDAYAYTKALGEKALLETTATSGLGVSIVRPSIIESAMAEPFPGWIRGFRMAEPVIISYARGLLKEFPGVPEGTVDVIPVDMVVAAICAVAARGHRPGDDGTDIVQVASGSVNPLKYGQLVDLTQSWFTEHPLYDERGQPIAVSSWSFPGRGRVQKQLERAKTLIERTEAVVHKLPLRGRQAEFGAILEDRREQAERALGYVELYGAYAECEAIYGLDRLLALWSELDEADRTSFAFDPRVIDWTDYVHEVHLPSVVRQGRVKTTPGARSGPTRQRAPPGPGPVPRPPDGGVRPGEHPHRLQRGGLVRLAGQPPPARPGPGPVRPAHAGRGAHPAGARSRRPQRFPPVLLSTIRTGARRPAGAGRPRVVQRPDPHQVLSRRHPEGARAPPPGHRTVLITGALDFVVRPLEPLFDDIIAPSLGIKGPADRPVYDGRMTEVPPTGEARYQALADYAATHGLDLRESVAYADSASDLPMLEAVGFPVAVNPETKLATLARKRGWLVEHFAKSPGGPRKLLPLAPRKSS